MTKHSPLAFTGLLVGGFLAASAVMALAQVSGWTSAPANPPANNTTAPINVGITGVNALQEKFDSLMIDRNLGVLGNLVYVPGGTHPTNCQVLVASGTDGTVMWGNGGGSSATSTTYGGYTHIQAFTSSGSVTIPSGVTHVKVRAWGGGGGGYAGYTYNHGYMPGAGGGGGAYVESILTLSPGTYSVTVGHGGGPRTNSGSGSGQNGTASSFQSVSAGGGAAAYTSLSIGSLPQPGSGGTGTGDVVIPGGIGSGVAYDGVTGLDGYGGDSPTGGQGGATTNGQFPGGGGGAAQGSATPGADGMVIIEY